MVNIKRTALVPIMHSIENVTHADLDAHSIDLTGIVPEGTVAVFINGEQTAGTGFIDYYPFGVTTEKPARASTMKETHTIGLKDMKLHYRLTVINDVFDIRIWHAWVSRFD